LLDPGKQWLNPKRSPRRWVQLIQSKRKRRPRPRLRQNEKPEKEEENLGTASPKDISDTHLLPFPREAKKPMVDEKFSRFVEVIRRVYIHIPMLDDMQARLTQGI
jgi:hypothetical protein